MHALDHSATAASDIVVELSGVHKTFRQKQRSSELREILRTMVRPQVRLVQAVRPLLGRGSRIVFVTSHQAHFIRTVETITGATPEAAGTDPPTNPVFPPCGNTGTPNDTHASTTAATSAVLAGRTTHTAGPRKRPDQSVTYDAIRSGSVMQCSSPTMLRSA